MCRVASLPGNKLTAYSDTIVLDDFKTALDRLKAYKLRKISGTISISESGEEGEFVDMDQALDKKTDTHPRHLERPADREPLPGPNDDMDFETFLRLDASKLHDPGDPEKG